MLSYAFLNWASSVFLACTLQALPLGTTVALLTSHQSHRPAGTPLSQGSCDAHPHGPILLAAHLQLGACPVVLAIRPQLPYAVPDSLPNGTPQALPHAVPGGMGGSAAAQLLASMQQLLQDSGDSMRREITTPSTPAQKADWWRVGADASQLYYCTL